MINMEVFTPISTQWLPKCLPRYPYEGYVDYPSRPYLGNVSANVSWVQVTDRETSKSLTSLQEKENGGRPRTVAPPKPSSIQLAGKGLLGWGETTCENSLQESESIQWYHDTFEDASIIRGLLEDVAKTCLALVRREDFPSLRNVCKAWWNLVQTQEFFLTRKRVGTLEEWLYVNTGPPGSKSTRWEVLNPKEKGDWKVLPPMPGMVKFGSSNVVVNEKLVVVGGLVQDGHNAYASAEVYIYDPVLDKWSNGASMKGARYEFACGVVGGKVYAVGGHGADGEDLSTMEVYDLEKDEWTCSSPLKKPRWGCFGAGVNGKLYVLGGRSSFTLGSARFMDVFDPETQEWHEVKNGCTMVLSHAVIKGKIFCIEWKDERSLRCYNTANNSWTKVVMPLPSRCRAGFCLGTYGGKIQFFPNVVKPNHETIVYDPQAPKGSEWQTTWLKARGSCQSCVTMTA